MIHFHYKPNCMSSLSGRDAAPIRPFFTSTLAHQAMRNKRALMHIKNGFLSNAGGHQENKRQRLPKTIVAPEVGAKSHFAGGSSCTNKKGFQTTL